MHAEKRIILILLCICTLTTNAQNVQKIAQESSDEAVRDIERLMNNKIGDDLKLVGIGDLATLVKETQTFNASLCKYLIVKKGFKNIILLEDEWEIRPLNNYITDQTVLDTAELNSLMRSCLSGPNLSNVVFRSFLIWLKNYNRSREDDKINIYGVTPDTSIPSSYFLSAYISKLDQSTGLAFAKKWDEQSFTQAQSFQDVENWYSTADRSSLSGKQKELIEDCRLDIAHNKNIFKILSADQKYPIEHLEKQFHYISARILAITSRKSILFTESRIVVRSDYVSNITNEAKQIASIGKLIHQHLQSQYFVCVPDFCSPIGLPIVNLSTQAINIETFPPSEKAKQILTQKDSYFSKTDSKMLNGFLPTTIPFIKGRNNTLIYDKALIPFDALFLFKELSLADPIAQP